jgi:3-methyl-2-oxobutanoate hydroxymethyltransferase
MAETTRFLVERGIPVCSHIGLTPQFVNAFGGYRVQGRGDDAQRVVNDAKALAEAGASLIVMECVPAALAKEITETVKVPTIGIGAGVDTSGQVLVLHDMLGVYPGKKAKFVKNFMEEAGSIQGAVQAYVKAVKDQSFPAAEHTY